MAILTISSRIFLPRHLNMIATCVHNISLFEDFRTNHGKIKGNALQLVGGINVGDDWNIKGKQQIEGYLAAAMWVLSHTVAACPSRTIPSLVPRVQPQGSDPL